eukprot:197860-Hanusia_phi.AAC.1
MEKDLQRQHELCDYLSAQLRATNRKVYRLQVKLEKSQNASSLDKIDDETSKDDNQVLTILHTATAVTEHVSFVCQPPTPPQLLSSPVVTSPHVEEDWTPNRASVFDVKQGGEGRRGREVEEGSRAVGAGGGDWTRRRRCLQQLLRLGLSML